MKSRPGNRVAPSSMRLQLSSRWFVDRKGQDPHPRLASDLSARNAGPPRQGFAPPSKCYLLGGAELRAPRRATALLKIRLEALALPSTVPVGPPSRSPLGYQQWPPLVGSATLLSAHGE